MHDLILRFADPVTPEAAEAVRDAIDHAQNQVIPGLVDIERREKTDSSVSSEERKVWKMLYLARLIVKLGDTRGIDFASAQNRMMSMGYDLAEIVLETMAMAGYKEEVSIAARVHDAKELAAQVIASWPAEAGGYIDIQYAVQLLERAADELEKVARP